MRKSVQLFVPSNHFLKNKKILITGAAGSIGSALARSIAKFNPRKLILLDQDETGIFDIYEELKDVARVEYVIASIREADAMFNAFGMHKPNIVYHVAAYKHVALMEKYPEEAHKTNVEGTQNVIDAARLGNAEKFILVSTDKAVYPKCVMGETKEQAEKLCLGANDDPFGRRTKFIVVRFGNVMASRGSLVPIFQKQITENKNLTVTHPKMERYMMGIYDAVELVIKASVLGKGGEIFVLDMGKPMKIVEFAKLMIRISGKPLEVEYTKPKRGEKFTEVLMTEDEAKRAKKIDNLYVIR